jgi:methylphosphotriester-DNA--protein-cysteine methyltransferase
MFCCRGFERAKQRLRDPKRSIIDAGLDAGFQNSSDFARIFRKLEGITSVPSGIWATTRSYTETI